MSEKKHHVSEGGERVDEPRGAGHLIETTVPEPVRDERHDESDARDEVTEASEESFPASDPPQFHQGHAENVEIERDNDADGHRAP